MRWRAVLDSDRFTSEVGQENARKFIKLLHARVPARILFTA
jgi:hypothetical protein